MITDEYLPAPDEELKLPPHSIEAEQGILGCILLSSSSALTLCRERLPAGPDSFYDSRHQTLYRIMLAMDDEGFAVDTLTLTSELRDHGLLEESGGPQYLSSLPETVPSAANLEFYTAIVADKFNRRKLIAHCQKLIASALNDETQDAPVEKAIRELETFSAPGITPELYRMADLEESYAQHVKTIGSHGINLGKWLPTLGRLRTVIPGEMVVFLGATGIGKTALLSNIALLAAPMPTLFFQLELPKELLFERLLALRTKMPCWKIESSYASGDRQVPDFWPKAFPGLLLCTSARIDVADIDRRIKTAEVMGSKPIAVLVDYMGLLQGRGSSRYDRFSQIAEDLRLLAKSRNVILFIASQIGRKSADEGEEVRLTDGKESGSIENSASLVIGAWRDHQDTTLIHLKVLKGTKGGGGTCVDCNYNLDTLAITERSKYHTPDEG